MLFSGLVALALIGIAIVGFPVMVYVILTAARSYGSTRNGKNTDDDMSTFITANADDRNPYAPTHAQSAKRSSNFRTIAFSLLMAFAAMLTLLLTSACAVLLWRWLGS
jgi:hypothetical protein